ncbi:olfactory receptor 6N1-like [Osmerus eperlanus]|uniref:olfactory receptor 6N1-like n=1 Tax=Osmerus eperlanus TaxID=29151 RepID=UPI002E0DF511
MNKFVYFPLTLLTYLLIILVNLTLIITIILEKGLHEPMYIFLCNLCINALYGTAGFYPRFLSDLLSDDQVISYGGCVTQGFVIYTSVMCEITLLTAMAYDRYVAICKPLQYHTLLAPVTVGKIIIFAWLTLFDVLNGFYGDQNMPLNLRNLMALQFLIIPPVFNPVIYGLNLQKVRTAVFTRKDKISYQK